MRGDGWRSARGRLCVEQLWRLVNQCHDLSGLWELSLDNGWKEEQGN